MYTSKQILLFGSNCANKYLVTRNLVEKNGGKVRKNGRESKALIVMATATSLSVNTLTNNQLGISNALYSVCESKYSPCSLQTVPPD